jgi:transcriptional activator of glycolytic enzymes GCR1
MQFTLRSALEAPPPLTGASFGPAAPVPLPVETLAKAAEKPRYRMSRTATTIPALWKEWTVGLQGQLSIEALDSHYGPLALRA